METNWLVHNIGDINHSNYTSRQKVANSKGVLTLDGVYLNVYENRDLLDNRDVILFVMGDYIGGDNTFDLQHVPRLEKYCTWKQIEEMVDAGAELGWHSWSHPDLTTLSKEEIIKEITPPFPMKYFSYPYGKYNDLVVECVKEAGYEKAYSVFQTNNDIWTIPRRYL